MPTDETDAANCRANTSSNCRNEIKSKNTQRSKEAEVAIPVRYSKINCYQLTSSNAQTAIAERNKERFNPTGISYENEITTLSPLTKVDKLNITDPAVVESGSSDN